MYSDPGLGHLGQPSSILILIIFQNLGNDTRMAAWARYKHTIPRWTQYMYKKILFLDWDCRKGHSSMNPLEKTILVFLNILVISYLWDLMSWPPATPPGALLVTYLDSFTALHKILVICSRLSTRKIDILREEIRLNFDFCC